MRWEYLVLSTQDAYADTEADFNDLGDNGWELVAVDSGIAFFKRQIASIYD